MNSLKANRPPVRWLVAVSALSFGLAAGHALGEGPGDAPSVQVSYADLDLSKEAGAEALYRRIQAAARSVCVRADGRDIERFRLSRQCYDDSIEGALAQADLRSLYAVHHRETQAPAPGLASSARVDGARR